MRIEYNSLILDTEIADNWQSGELYWMLNSRVMCTYVSLDQNGSDHFVNMVQMHARW